MINTVEKWLNGNKLGIDIVSKKYMVNGETFQEWLDRISGGDKELRDLIEQKKFLFGGRTLASRGTGNGMSYSNCYSSGYAPDSVDGMMDLNKNLALTYKSSGGQGLSLSKVRPKGSPVRNGIFVSDGIVPFMELFNQTTASISQGGSRKGALMMSLDIFHPEIETFISIKDGTNKITKANLSVEIPDEFMKLVEDGVTSYTYTSFGKEYTINPTELYNKIMQRTWSSAEPGVIFTDKFRNRNLMQCNSEYVIITSNPCGEQPLPKNGACNLGSINLMKYVINPFTEQSSFDYYSFNHDIYTYVRALDDVLEEGKDLHALEEQREMAKNYRNIGLGMMGLGSALMALGLRYGKDSFEFVERVSRDLFVSSLQASALLAKERGAFPKCNKEEILNSDIIKESNVPNHVIELIQEYGLRNCSLLSVAPSGSIGTALDISTGLEPYYALSYKRRTESLHGEKDVYYDVEVDISKKAREAFGEYVCVSALTIDWKERVELQGIMQRYIDTAISSTVNVKEDIKIEELRDLYIHAWKQGLKGITIYREGSFEAILSTGKESKKDEVKEMERGVMDKVPEDTFYIPKTLINGCGQAKVMIGYSPSQHKVTDIYYIAKGQGGCSKNIQGEAILISQVLRLGGKLEDVKKSFAGIDACSSCTFARTKGIKVDGKNCPNILLGLVIDFQNEMNDPNKPKHRFGIEPEYIEGKIGDKVVVTDSKYVCEVCGNIMHPSGGCFECEVCGHSHCGL